MIMSSTAACRPVIFKSVFVTSNESAQREAVEQFDKIDCVGTAAIGVSGMGFLNYVCRKERFEKIIAVDVSPKVAAFWQLVVPIIRNAITRTGCARAIRRTVREHRTTFFTPHTPTDVAGANIHANHLADRENSRLNEEIHSGISWLSDDTRFHRIQEIFRSRGGFTFIQEDLRYLAGNQDFQEALGDSRTGLFYLSNVCDYIKTTLGQESYAKSIEAFTDDDTVIVHSENDLEQHVVLKENYVPDFPETEEAAL